MYTPQGLAFSICCLFLILSFSTFAQVGIGTTNPNSNAKLDITSTVAEPGGLLLPRLALTGTANTTPLAAHVAGMTVYNTATAGDVTPGYYYNDGSQWVRIAAASVPSNDWTILGNSGLNANNNFLGTTDNVALRFRTNNADRFEISTGNAASRGRLRAFENGDAAAPIYSWNANVGTGMFQQAANVIGFSTAGIERFRLGSTSAIFNDNSNDVDFRIESDGQANMFYLDASTNRIGIQTNSPSYTFHLVNSGNIGVNTNAYIENTGIDGVSTLIRNTGNTNIYNGLEAGTSYNGNTNVVAAIFGLAVETTGAAIGVRGVSNSSDGIGVRGSVPTTGTWLGFGGYFSGGLAYSGGVYNLSDARAKKNILPIQSALDKILNINGVSYNYDMKKFNSNASEDLKTYYGFIAQNVKEYLPFAVAEKSVPFENMNSDYLENLASNSNTLNVVDYTSLIPVLVEAIKEQQTQIKELQKEIKLMKEKI